MKEVTVVDDLNNIRGNTAFEEMIFSIRRDDYKEAILHYRRILASGDKSAYEKAKKALRAFTPSATFKGRRLMQFMLKYSYIIVLDFDKLSPAELVRVKEIVRLSPFTVACFISPSGNGLKVFVCVKSGPEKHLQAFLSAREHYRLLTGVEIDGSGKDITRLCFVSWDPDLYYNPAAKVFDWEKGETGEVVNPKSECNIPQPSQSGQGVRNTPLPPGKMGSFPISGEMGHDPIFPPPRQTPTGNDEIFRIYKRCKCYVEKYVQYIPGSRHTFVLKLALEVRKKGIPEVMALFLIPQDYDLEINEVNQIIRDVYRFDLTRENGVQTKPTSQPTRHPSTSSNETQNIESQQQEPQDEETQNIESQHQAPNPLSNDPKRPKPTTKKKAIPDPDVEEIIFPLVDELDKLYLEGGEPVFPEESAAQAKMRVKMGYSLRIVEIMLSKMLDFMHNVVNGRVLWRRKGSDDPFQPARDHEENSMLRWLHLHDQIISVSMLHNILTSNFSKHFNPFTDYLRNLKKVDSTIDYIGQLIATVRTEDDAYWGKCFRKWFVAYVMSLYSKKVINHTIIVLVGGQGIGKTSFFRTLVPNALREYLSPTATAADQKDSQLMLAECCLIILDELEALNRRDLAAFKDLVTLEFVHIRRPYGRFAANLNRYASIIASVNSTQILTDPTGSRRYLCSTVKSIDYQHTVDIDACMAQALRLGKSGFKYWFDQDEIRELSDHNEAYMAKSVEEEYVETWLRPVSVEEWNDRANLSYGKNISLMKAADVSVFLAGKTKQSLNSSTNTLVGKILKKLEFTRLCKNSGYYWIIRVMTDDEVARSRKTLDDSESVEDFERDLNRYNNPDQFIEGKRKEDELPF